MADITSVKVGKIERKRADLKRHDRVSYQKIGVNYSIIVYTPARLRIYILTIIISQ